MQIERYAVVDVETTGFSPTKDRIVEIGCVLVDGGRIAGSWSSLVAPGIPIPERATDVHGITDAMVAGAPQLGTALARLRALCAGRIVAAHCAGFDLSFLPGLGANRALCTMRLARALVPESPNYKNQTLRRVLGVDRRLGETLGAHRALDDAMVSAHVLILCRERFSTRYPHAAWNGFIQQHAMLHVATAA